MEPFDPAARSDVESDELRRRREIEAQARTARRRLDDTALRARRALERQADDMRRRAAAVADRADDDRGRRAGAARPARRGPSPETSWEDLDDKALVWVLPAVALAALPLIAGHLAAVVSSGDAPSYRLVDAPGILWRLVSHPGDPAGAWEPVNTGGAVPGEFAFWVTSALVALVVGLVGLLVWAAVRPASRHAGEWGTVDDHHRALRVRRKDPHRLVLGKADGQLLAVRDRHSLLVVGPAHSGKTSGVVVPAVVEWDGPVVVASTKGHFLDETIGWRSRQGEVHVYDPAASTAYHRSGWSLLADCGTWHGAIRTASDLTLAARATARGGSPASSDGGSDAWRGPLSMALAPYLLAAVAGGRSIGQTAEWIEREERDEVLAILEDVDVTAARIHRTTFSRADAARSRFLHTIHDILTVYDDPVVATSADRHDIDTDELLDGGAHTLYLTTPEYDQQRFRPLCALIVRRVVAAAFGISAQRSTPLDPPLLVVLDDVTGIAPLDDLAALASTAAHRGVQLVSVFQDRDRIDDQYGDAADMVVRNHAARLVLPGHAGDRAHGEPLLDPALERDLAAGEAALVYGSNLPLRVALRPWYADRGLRRRVETPQDEVPSVIEGPVQIPVSVADQTALWRRRVDSPPSIRINDPSIPMDVRDRRFVEVFGSIDEDDTGPIEIVTPISERRRRRPH